MTEIMTKTIAICPNCHAHIPFAQSPEKSTKMKCPTCGVDGVFSIQQETIEELEFYGVQEPFAFVKIIKDTHTLDKFYKVIEPFLSEQEEKIVVFVQEKVIQTLDVSLEGLERSKAEEYIEQRAEQICKDYSIQIDDVLLRKIVYYLVREMLEFGKITPLMHDPNIEDISCDGANVPIFLYHRMYGSLQSNIVFHDGEELTTFVIKLAQKCGKHISIAEPMLDATMPDGSRIQMTLGTEVTTKGSTFTIRKFRADPFTPIDLINFNTMSAEMVAYLWMVVENGVNALIAGGTASGKTSTLNALSLFIPHDSKIVSIEETREINLPHPNWIPGVSRSGFGEIVANRFVGEIDMYDLMKAALRQRPDYILVGEIRGKEAYVLFQAMATGHTTYSTFHADSAKSLIHRLEGKPIEIPRVMLSSLNLVTIQISTRVKGKSVRRCKQIIEIIDIDPSTREILTNEVFRWDPVDDTFVYSGKSYVLERIRARWDLSRDQLLDETRRRVEILEWMRKHNIRSLRDVASSIVQYKEMPDEFMNKLRTARNEGEDTIKKEDDTAVSVSKKDGKE